MTEIILPRALKKALSALVLFGIGSVFSLIPATALASEHVFTGTVTEIQPDSIVIGNGGETLRFSRSARTSESQGRSFRVGDSVRIVTDLKAKRIEKKLPTKQQAGSRGHEILDDRAFYSALREELSSPEKGQDR